MKIVKHNEYYIQDKVEMKSCKLVKRLNGQCGKQYTVKRWTTSLYDVRSALQTVLQQCSFGNVSFGW